MTEPVVHVVTDDELEAKRIQLEVDWPQMAAWWAEAREDCHVKCYRWSNILPTFGGEASDAFGEYDAVQWMLGNR